jgi:hypothetical protein
MHTCALNLRRWLGPSAATRDQSPPNLQLSSPCLRRCWPSHPNPVDLHYRDRNTSRCSRRGSRMCARHQSSRISFVSRLAWMRLPRCLRVLSQRQERRQITQGSSITPCSAETCERKYETLSHSCDTLLKSVNVFLHRFIFQRCDFNVRRVGHCRRFRLFSMTPDGRLGA